MSGRKHKDVLGDFIDRVREGKDASGLATVSTWIGDDTLNLTVSDDGKGIDRQKILARDRENGLLTDDEADAPTDNDILKLIFAPGLFTAEEVTEGSGRGVGLDLVADQVRRTRPYAAALSWCALVNS